MKQQWTSKWKASVQPRKQRKYRHAAPPHVRGKLMGAHLDKALRQKYKRRSIPIRTGDKVKVLRGQFRGNVGKVERVFRAKGRMHVAGIEIAKRDGSKVPYLLHPSNVTITELNLSDKRRLEERT